MFVNFIFDGVSCDAMDIYPELKSYPAFAEPKTVYEDIPGTDGEINYSASNPKKRMCFKPRIIEFECHLGPGFADINSADSIPQLSQIANWLMKKENKQLIVSCEPDIYYMGHVANLFNFEHISQSSGVFPLVFKCQPFRYGASRTLPIRATSTAVTNKGYYTPAIFEVTGNLPEGFTIHNNFSNTTLTVNSPVSGSTAIINTGDMTATVNGVSVLHQCEGDFFEIPPGSSRIWIKANGSAASNFTATVNFQQIYL